MAAMRLEQVQRFIIAKKISWGYGHFNPDSDKWHSPAAMSLDTQSVIYKSLNLFRSFLG